MGIAVTETRSSTTEPMLVGDAFTSSCGAARGARNLISRDLSACRSRRGDWASSPDVVLSPVWLSESASNEGGIEFSYVGAHRDRDPATGLRTNWTTPDLRVRSCHVQEHVDGPFRPTYYVAPPHDATQAHRQRPPNFIAPFCGPGGGRLSSN